MRRHKYCVYNHLYASQNKAFYDDCYNDNCDTYQPEVNGQLQHLIKLIELNFL